jgi:DNA repair exonuclease SbcCD ATPase subunit
MRIHRISLRNFRGVEEVDVEFDPDGVTVVVGPNEVGKTSLADALTFLLDHKDSAARAGIRDAQPIGRDVGPFVEAELTVGRHRFVYRKQWLKGRKTELEVIAPQLEQLAGDAAHDRVARMLEEEADMGLFRALRYQQGLAITQASVGGATSLATALDAAAGGNANAAAQDGLLDRARVEFRRYFTEKGAILATRKNRLEELEQRRARAGDIGQQLASLEQAAERQQRLEDDLRLLRDQLPEAEDRVNQQTQAVAEIEQIERRVAEMRHQSELAAATLREAHVGQKERERLASAHVEAAVDREKLTQEAGDAASSLQEAQTAEATAASALSDANSQVQASEEEAASVVSRF